jgi:chromosome segregation ATPase
MGRLGPGAPRVTRAEAVKRKEVRKELGAQLVRDVKAAVVKGERRGFAQGKAQGKAAGEVEGIEQAKAEFEKKSLFVKLADFLKGLTKENEELRKKLSVSESAHETLSGKFDKLRSTASGYFQKLKKLMPELELLRSKEVVYAEQVKKVQDLSTNLTKTQSQLLNAKDRISVLTVELESYKEKEKAMDAEKMSKHKAAEVEKHLATIVKRSRKHDPGNSSVDLG